MKLRAMKALLAFSIGLNLILAGAWVMNKLSDDTKTSERESKKTRLTEISPDLLNLTEPQRRQWEQARLDQVRETLRMRQRSLTRLDKLNQVLTSDETTTEGLHRFTAEMNEGSSNYASRILETYLRQREILNPDQELRLRAEMQKRLAEMRQFNQKRFDDLLQQTKNQYGDEFIRQALANDADTTAGRRGENL